MRVVSEIVFNNNYILFILEQPFFCPKKVVAGLWPVPRSGPGYNPAQIRKVVNVKKWNCRY